MVPDSSDSSHSLASRPEASKHDESCSATERKPKLAVRKVHLEGDAIETFSFNVSAAEAADLEQQHRIDSASSATVPARKILSSQPKLNAEGSNLTFPQQSALSEQADYFHIVTSVKPQKKTPSWVASLMLHAVLLLPLGILSQPTQQLPPDASILVYLEPSEPFDENETFEDIEIDPVEELEIVETELTSQLSGSSIAGLTELSAEAAFQKVSGEVAIKSESLEDLGKLFGKPGQGDSGFGEGLGNSPLADFFGTKVVGNRIVYIVDNSGGMITGELETLIAELLRSVQSLNRKQQFYVIFYSDSLYPIFYPNAPQHFVSATNENKQLLEDWLDTVELCLGNVVDEALAAAAAIRPDVVYLLTDGDLDSTRDQRRIRFLLDSSGRSFPIHTFGLGTGKTGKAAQKLKQVAQANHGSFRAVEITPDFIALAKIKARPYHNKSPGEVWGLRVGKRAR